MGERVEPLPGGFLTQDPSTLVLLEMAEKIAVSDVTVLIQGESGTGKELIAKQIQQKSRRAQKPLIAINCGALQETLLLSELFGHERGAFTGAVSEKKGLVELANGGTLFLDEIGEMGPQTQSKFLRFLQEGEFFRVGGQNPIHVDVRVISATNKNLEKLVSEKKFREDLLYRINTVTLRINPLRQRKGDIPLLLSHFLNLNNGNNPKRISEEALIILENYKWPGNVRELQNTVERFKILTDGDTISLKDIPLQLKQSVQQLSGNDDTPTFLLDQIEKRHILHVLDHYRGNKTKAAKAMGITVKTLYNKLARYESTGDASKLVH